MEFRHLRYFLAVAETLSFTSAAKKLGIAQPPLSTQIKQLETQIGQPLFYRSSRKVTLTEAGLLLSREASAILEQADLLSAKMADLRDGRGTGLSIGITEDLATLALAKILRKFMKKHRGVRCDIRFHRTGPREFSNGFDVMIVDRSEIGNAEALDLGPAPIYLAVCRKHRLADKESIEPNDIIGEHLLQSPPGFLSLAESLILSGNPQLSSRFSVERVKGGTNERIWRAEAGLGVTIISEGEATRAGVTTGKFTPEGGVIRPILVYRDKQNHPGVAALLSHFTEVLTL